MSLVELRRKLPGGKKSSAPDSPGCGGLFPFQFATSLQKALPPLPVQVCVAVWPVKRLLASAPPRPINLIRLNSALRPTFMEYSIGPDDVPCMDSLIFAMVDFLFV